MQCCIAQCSKIRKKKIVNWVNSLFFKKKEKFHTEHYVSGQDDIFVCYYFILFKDKNTKVVNKIPMCIRN